MLLNNYHVSEQTILLTGVYGRYNHLQTMIIDGNHTYRFNGSSEQILSSTLKKTGSSMRQEIDYSRRMLGNLKMYPIRINSLQGLYFFPSKSPKKPDCVWFSLIHVKGAKVFGKNKTRVYLSYGHTIIIDYKLSTFNNKLRRAQEFRRLVVERENSPVTFYLEPRKNLQTDNNNRTSFDPSTIINDSQEDIPKGKNEG